MKVTMNTVLLLEERVQSALLMILLILLFFPYVWVVSFIIAFYLGASVYASRFTKQLTNELTLTWHQSDSILFKDEPSRFTVSLTNAYLLNSLSRHMYIRTPDDGTYKVHLEGETTSIVEVDEIPDTLQFELTGRKRGQLEVDDITLTIVLPLRLGSMTLVLTPPLEWVVYPSITSKQQQRIRTKLKLGERVSRHSPLKDRSQQLSSKPYEKEPSRQIDWYATAKRSTLQSKVYQPVNQDTFTLLLDLSAKDGIGLHHRFEELIEDTAVICRELIESGGKVELFINRLDRQGRVTHLTVQEGPRQLKNILALLSSLSNQDRYMGSSRFTPYVMRVKNKQAEMIHVQ